MAPLMPIQYQHKEQDDTYMWAESSFRNWIKDGGRFVPEAGRYHLYVSLACPWACGTLSMLNLKGLDEIIGHSVVHPTWARTRPDDLEDDHCGWHFRSLGDSPVPSPLGYGSFPCDSALKPDVVNNCRTVRELYNLAGADKGPYSTPVLWDKKEGTIVNNDSLDILKMFNSSFNALCACPEIELFPAELDADLAKLNELVYNRVNVGVYKAGFARSQATYEAAVNDLFTAMDHLDERLASKRFLTGSKFTYVDLRLFHTLARFDPVYNTCFKCNLKRMSDYPNLLGFTRDVYSMTAVRRCINMDHIKLHYFTSYPQLNTFAMVPLSNGPDLERRHGREHLDAQHQRLEDTGLLRYWTKNEE